MPSQTNFHGVLIMAGFVVALYPASRGVRDSVPVRLGNDALEQIFIMS
jgi:hypothetical protein